MFSKEGMDNLLVTNDKEAIQDYLWNVCLGFHNYCHDSRKEILSTLKNRSKDLDAKIVFWVAVYLMGSYFSDMNNCEKNDYIDIILSLDKKDNYHLWGDIFELSANIYIAAPDIKKPLLFEFLCDNIKNNIELPAVVCSFCYASERIFSDLDNCRKDVIINIINRIRSCKIDETISGTIDYTLEKFKGMEK